MMSRSRQYQVLLALIVCLCISTTLVPYLLLSSSQDTLEAPTTFYFRKTIRKALDIKTKVEPDELKTHITELERIQVSVRNELRELEKKRVKIVQETEEHKAALYKLQDQINDGKKQVQLTQAELAKVSHEVYAATLGNIPTSLSVTEAPPIIILPPILLSEANQKPHPLQSIVDITSQCALEPTSCLNYHRCPISKPFKIYLYSASQFSQLKFIYKQPLTPTNFHNYLKTINSLTTDPQEACLFVIILGPLEKPVPDPSQINTILHSLPYWNQDGSNHILINLSDMSSDNTLVSKLNPMKATVVQSVPSKQWRRGHDILAPPITQTLEDQPLWKMSVPQVPAYRKNLLYFEGHLFQGTEKETMVAILNRMEKVLSKNETIYIQTTCNGQEVGGVADEWVLCGNEQTRSRSLSQSTFTLILSQAHQTSLSNQIRLAEALKYGAIPVVIGTMEMIFDPILDWSQVTLQLPMGRFHEVHYIIRSMSHNRVLELRRLGRFFWETYFSSPLQIVKSAISIMRYRLLHPPPPIPDFQSSRTKSYGETRTIFKSPTFISNFSIYTHEFWNQPPGPFYLYPHTPTQPVPVTGSLYTTLDLSQLKKLPPHIVQAGGITGPYFQNYLLGNTPDEYFTVVMLTYRREDVVKESIERLRGLSYLAKVIVVWNDPENSPYILDWPKLSVPLEVIWSKKNSLNNRFIPYDSIETEAVLSIDDDVYLRHDEIQFAFRVWRESRDRLVGFPGRFHAYDIHHKTWLYNSNYTCELSMVLTGAAFCHKYYFYLYTWWQPQAIRDVVDMEMNCEDIAMNFLIAHITRKPPLKVTSRWTFRCPSCPDNLSQNDAHFNERHKCMNFFTQVFGYMPLLYTQYRLDSVLFKTRLPSHLEKCYQYV